MMIPGKAFAGLLVMIVADLLHLSPFRRQFIFSRFSDKDCMKHLSGLLLWHLSKYAELPEVATQNDKLFIDLLNKVRVADFDVDVEKLLKARFIYKSDENYPKDALNMLFQMVYQVSFIQQRLITKFKIILYKYPLVTTQAAQNKKQTKPGGLKKLLKLKIGAKVMLTVLHTGLSN